MDDNLETVLHKACSGLKLDLVTLFVEWEDKANAENKLDIDKFTLNFCSPLINAISAPMEEKKSDELLDPVNGVKLEIILFLISKGAKVQYTEKDFPSQSDQKQFQFGIQGGSSKKSKARHTFSQPLINAVRLGSPALVKYLVKKGADVNIITEHSTGGTPKSPMDFVMEWLEKYQREEKLKKNKQNAAYMDIDDIENQNERLISLKRSVSKENNSITFLERMLEIYEEESQDGSHPTRYRRNRKVRRTSSSFSSDDSSSEDDEKKKEERQKRREHKKKLYEDIKRILEEKDGKRFIDLKLSKADKDLQSEQEDLKDKK